MEVKLVYISLAQVMQGPESQVKTSSAEDQGTLGISEFGRGDGHPWGLGAKLKTLGYWIVIVFLCLGPC